MQLVVPVLAGGGGRAVLVVAGGGGRTVLVVAGGGGRALFTVPLPPVMRTSAQSRKTSVKVLEEQADSEQPDMHCCVMGLRRAA